MFHRIVGDFLLNAFGLAVVPDDDVLVWVVLDANHLIVVAIVVKFSCHNHIIFYVELFVSVVMAYWLLAFDYHACNTNNPFMILVVILATVFQVNDAVATVIFTGSHSALKRGLITGFSVICFVFL